MRKRSDTWIHIPGFNLKIQKLRRVMTVTEKCSYNPTKYEQKKQEYKNYIIPRPNYWKTSNATSQRL